MRHIFVIAAICLTQLVAACSTDMLTGTLSSDQNSPEALGKQAFLRGNPGLAIRHFEDALAISPSSIRALNGLAASYDLIGRFDVARRYYERALTLNGRSLQTLNNLGYSYLLQGQRGLAVAYFREALAVDRKNKTVHGNLLLAERAAPKTRSVAKNVGATHKPRFEPVSHTRVLRLIRLDLGTQFLTRAPVSRHAALPGQSRLATRNKAQARSMGMLGQRPRNLAMLRAIGGAGDGSRNYQREVIEVANGTGRGRMAARMRLFLGRKGLHVQRLTNADRYSYRATVIQYKTGHRNEARELANLLPTKCRTEVRNDMLADVRVTLGADLLEFDAHLIRASRDKSLYASR